MKSGRSLQREHNESLIDDIEPATPVAPLPSSLLPLFRPAPASGLPLPLQPALPAVVFVVRNYAMDNVNGTPLSTPLIPLAATFFSAMTFRGGAAGRGVCVRDCRLIYFQALSAIFIIIMIISLARLVFVVVSSHSLSVHLSLSLCLSLTRAVFKVASQAL